jgi:hypothetical protein
MQITASDPGVAVVSLQEQEAGGGRLSDAIKGMFRASMGERQKSEVYGELSIV